MPVRTDRIHPPIRVISVSRAYTAEERVVRRRHGAHGHLVVALGGGQAVELGGGVLLVQFRPRRPELCAVRG